MPNMTGPGKQPSSLQKYGMLLMGIFLVILAGGRFVTPVAAFLAPVFLLMYTRNTGTRFGISVLYILLFVSLAVRLHDYLPVSKSVHFAIVAGLALLETVPFLVDRKLHHKLPVAMVPFVLPSAFVAIGFVGSVLLPLGTLSAAAYSQIYNFELMQLAAVTGIYGITFVLLWFASTMASLWGSGFVWRSCRKQFLPMSICLMLIFVSGGFRNIFDENESSTVRVAGIAADQAELQKSLRNAGVDNKFERFESTDEINSVLSSYHDNLFARSAIEAKAGAKIISWAEGDGVIFEQHETAFLHRAADFAKQHKVYLVAALIFYPVATDQAPQNKLLVFAPDGSQAVEYLKTRHGQRENVAEGAGELAILDTPYGRIAFAIGQDLNAPRLMRQAGKSNADIIIAPSVDWRANSHQERAHMAAFRGVENGVSLFRVANKGLSIISDSHGLILAQADHYRTSPHTLVGEIPTGGVSTIYARSGDWFAWLNLLLLGGFVYRGYARK